MTPPDQNPPQRDMSAIEKLIEWNLGCYNTTPRNLAQSARAELSALREELERVKGKQTHQTLMDRNCQKKIAASLVEIESLRTQLAAQSARFNNLKLCHERLVAVLRNWQAERDQKGYMVRDEGERALIAFLSSSGDTTTNV